MRQDYAMTALATAIALHPSQQPPTAFLLAIYISTESLFSHHSIPACFTSSLAAYNTYQIFPIDAAFRF
nr:unnamed protein product [Digitaria exilis]